MTETTPKIIKPTKYDSLAFQFIEKVNKRKKTTFLVCSQRQINYDLSLQFLKEWLDHFESSLLQRRVNGYVIISQIWKRVESHHKERNLRCCSSNLNYTLFSFRLRWLCIYHHHLIMLSQIPRREKWKGLKN